jgi:penicillin amidase
MTANQRIIGTDYKYQQLARDAAMPWRARRILERLTEKKSFTMDDFTSIQTDSFNIPVSMLAKEIVRRGTASPETLKALTGWDGFMKKDSQAALLANEIRNVIAAKIAADNKGVLPQILREKLLYWVVEKDAKEWLPAGYSSYDSLIAAADEEARAALTKRYGADSSKWVWGAAWVSRFTHPLAMNPLIGANWASPSVPIDGSGQSPNVGSNVSMRLIASPGNWDATRHVIPLGESGDPKSPHWKDQFEMWRTGAPAVFPFSKEAVQKAAVETTEYGPGPIRSQKKN